MTTSELITKLKELDPEGSMPVFYDWGCGIANPKPGTTELFQGEGYIDYVYEWTEASIPRFTCIIL